MRNKLNFNHNIIYFISLVSHEINWNSTFCVQLPDIGAELTGGCSGFASKYMHWEEDLIVGGIQRNKTGYIQR